MNYKKIITIIMKGKFFYKNDFLFSGNITEFYALLNNLEKKINLKFEKQDNINKNTEEDFDRNKIDIDSIRSQVDKNSKNISILNERVDIIFSRLNDLKNHISENNDLITNDFNNKLDKFKIEFNLKLEE